MNDPKISRRNALLSTFGLLATSDARTTIDMPGITGDAVLIRAGEGQKGKIASSEIVFKLDATHTSGQFGCAELSIHPGQLGAPPHLHKGFDETCCLLEGSVHIMVEEEVFIVNKGDWHLRPRGKVHTFGTQARQLPG
jgi:uncharacterized cupin superfamily protein